MGRYIADFACHRARLIVEVDGESHDFEERQLRDKGRDEWFKAQDYLVLRITNGQVMSNLEGVVHVIREAADRRMLGSPPSLALPRKGGGNRLVSSSGPLEK